MKILYESILIILSAILLISCSGKPDVDKSVTISLFDGKTLNGWEGDSAWFHVEDGALVAGSLDKDIPYNMFLCTTEEYGDFELETEVKLLGPGDNSGIQIRSSRIPGQTEVSGYQADIGGPIGDFGIVWGSLYDESRRNKMLAIAEQEKIANTYRTHEWNKMKVRCEGDHIQIWINDVQTVDYTEENSSISQTGIIGLQIHKGAPTQVWFRNMKLTKL